MALGEKIKAGRKRKGLTQEELAEKLCVSRQAIQKWESDNGVPSIENLKAISLLFGVSIDSLISGEEAPVREEKLVREEMPVPEEKPIQDTPQNGEEPICRNTKFCPQCGTENNAVANFCKHCGHSFLSECVAPPPSDTEAQTESVPPQAVQALPQNSAAQWFKANLKIIVPLAVVLVVVIVMCALIPTFISLGHRKYQLSGTYYSYEDGKYNTEESFTFKNQTWKMKDDSESFTVSGTYKIENDVIIFYYQGTELFRGTLNEDVLTLIDPMGGEPALLCKKGHKHSFGEWKTEDPDCMTDGFEQRSCYCGVTESQVVPALRKHTLGEYTAAKKATCTEDGNVGYYRCTVCKKYFADDRATSEIKSVTIPASHTEGAWKVVKTATCTANGLKEVSCTVCGKTLQSSAIPASHTEGTWKLIRNATCADDGLRTLSCTVCGKVIKSDAIPATGAHVFERGACKVCSGEQFVYTLNNSYWSGSYYYVDGLSEIGENSTEIEIPASYNGYPVTTISSYAFAGSGFTSVVIPESVTDVRSGAFKNCKSLKTVYWNAAEADAGSSVYRVFENCPSFTTVIFGDSVKSIPKDAFYECESLSGTLSIPDSVTTIGSSSFYGCTGLTGISLGSKVSSIEYDAFYGCTGLTSVTLGSSVQSIGSKAFYGCSGIKSLEIANADIGDSAFFRCSGITSVTLGSGVKSIRKQAFRECSKIESITIPSASIGESAFEYCRGLKNVTIGDGVESIGENAFTECSGIEHIEISDSVTSIGASAFSHCSGLISIKMPNGITSIKKYTFLFCKSLTSIEIPDRASVHYLHPASNSGIF